LSSFTSFNPRTGEPGSVGFSDATPEEVLSAVEAASSAFAVLRGFPPARVAELLRAIAGELDGLGSSLVSVADRESGLGEPRLTGELARSTGQFRLFAELCEEGSFLEAVIDHARPNLTPPRPDLRRMLFPLGPVAVFGASNFPLAFSVPGGDTASALASRCPVVVKAHPAHPETSQMCADAILRALARVGAPAGTFSLVHGRDNTVGEALVTAPGIKAVGFTGSLRGGRALYDLAARREEPIPVYAEMGSVNPFFVTRAALEARLEPIAEGFVGSMTQGGGQFCTKPGLAFVPDTEAGRRWASVVASKVSETAGACLLSASIRDRLAAQVERTSMLPGVTVLAGGGPGPGNPGFTYPATVLSVDAATFRFTPELASEHFGPFGVIVRCNSAEEFMAVARGLHGNLTATVHAEPSDAEAIRPLVEELREKVGRLIWNGYPTGVAVTHAMVHGGPYPASTQPLHTSVGTAAVKRFLRPVAYQAYPAQLLPPELRDENPLGIMRLVDGRWSGRPAT
jgi:acyl-CoA reductase-like NAD-dependent aldehyde dehydrogenase